MQVIKHKESLSKKNTVVQLGYCTAVCACKPKEKLLQNLP